MDQNQGIKTWQWVVTVIVIIIVVVLGYYLIKGGSSSQTEMPPMTDQTPAATNEVNRIVISDQYPGNIVYVSSVQLAAPGWVAIHKDNNGTPGAIIGTQYFDAGINPGKITLTEKTLDGDTYYAMLHNDDGSKTFDATKDMPLKDSTGAVIMKSFRATTAVTETKG